MKKFLYIFLFTFLSINLFSNSLVKRQRPIVSDIQTKQLKGNKILLTWTLPENPFPVIKELIIFKSNKPISSYSDINNLTPVASVSSTTSEWTDKLNSYNDFYYAVIAHVENQKYNIILPSINSTVTGTRLKFQQKENKIVNSSSSKEKLYPVGTMRETPLPFLDFIENQDKKNIDLSIQAKTIAKTLGNDKTKDLTPLKQYIFEQDLISPDGGEDFLLFEILRKFFIQRNYTESEIQLKKLLGTNINKDVSDRAYFYLGESLYLQGKYNDSVKYFLNVYESYPELSKKWINSSLDLITIKE